jgi:hypothetical protein
LVVIPVQEAVINTAAYIKKQRQKRSHAENEDAVSSQEVDLFIAVNIGHE